ncbi:MarR family winged helix-turn-helix transcriptional regulator [Kribbella albertanoniae]|uniref:MarR family transcriptional regulator n=1 Tax=Kribbella albertanoniae TaxID=1266829 RepID=A0A4R4PYH4_9ACTN|nr:MarR family transcriptional regulator [Kribbella albertanoniae]TDC27630.1 MarR family transcriptional regulator [Kribbella albertanoniae]
MSSDDFADVLPRIAQLSTAMNRGRVAQQAMDATGLSLDRPGLTILVTLATAGTPLRIGEIADRMQVVGPHVTRQVQALEQRDLVQRVADPNDKRVSLIELTPTGAEAAQRYMTTVLGWFRDAVDDWPAQDRADLGRLLTKLADDVTTKLTEL